MSTIISGSKNIAMKCWHIGNLIQVQRSQFLVNRLTHIELNVRCFASKKNDVFKQELPIENVKSDQKFRKKTLDYKQKIYLKDLSGRMLGLKTREEAKLLADKNGLILVEDDSTKKIPSLRLVNPRTQLQDESSESSSESNSSSSTSDEEKNEKAKGNHVPKQMFFTTKLSEHDLQIKILQVKKLISKGQETLIKVASFDNSDQYNKLASIDRKFEEIFNNPTKFGIKINQKRLTNNVLKMNIVPVDMNLIKEWSRKDKNKKEIELPNLDEIDPNDLLKNTENYLKKDQQKPIDGTSEKSKP